MKPLATLLGLAVLVAGCGGQPAANTSTHDQAVAAWREVTQCFRDHGFAVPDAQIDDHGNATFPSDTPRTPDDVIAACQSALDRLPNQATASAPSAALIQHRREFAQCMRDHGVTTWPDPDAEGRFPDSPELAAQGKTPTLVAARDACQHFLQAEATP